jgi:predicted AAA+ superfamily ATPase
MIFLVGPRQAGKTTLCQIISGYFTNNLYFNWDIAEHRANFIQNPTFFEAVERKDSSTPIIVLDEIHKYKATMKTRRSILELQGVGKNIRVISY